MNHSSFERFPPVIRRASACLFLAATLGGIAGCSSAPTVSEMKETFSRENATVKVPFQGDVARVVVKLSHFPANQNAVDGLNALQREDFAAAEAKFQLAIADKPDNWSYHFALGVIFEATGKFPEAKREYENTNLLKGKGGYFDAEAGLKRIAARGP